MLICRKKNRNCRRTIFILPLFFLSISLWNLAGCKTGNSDIENEDTGIFRDITPAEASNLIQENQTNDDFKILDVRTPSEYRSGYIAGADNIDFYTDNFDSLLQALDKHNIYLVYCRSGNRSAQTLIKMEDMGFREAYNMLGGIIRWISEGFPVIQPA